MEINGQHNPMSWVDALGGPLELSFFVALKQKLDFIIIINVYVCSFLSLLCLYTFPYHPTQLSQVLC